MRKQNKAMILVFLLMSFLASQCQALVFNLPAAGNDVIGQVREILSKPGDNLHKIAQANDVGFFEMIEANRNLPQKDMPADLKVMIPTEYILPPGPRKGIVINLAEMRLYYFPKNKHIVYTFPIGIGRMGWQTPLGEARIISKEANPTWVVPATIKKWVKAEKGVTLPNKIGPGPDNPLGQYAMRLSIAGYLIHGTNEPSGVGMRSSSGCIRLFPKDIDTLFHLVKINTPVRIIDTPYKVGWSAHDLYLEAHQPLQETFYDKIDHQHSLTPMVQMILKHERQPHTYVDWELAQTIAENEQGIPQYIGTTQKNNLEILTNY